jgi:hypothetical protein
MQQAILSYSEEREVVIPFETPEAYVEWGGPSSFSIDDPPLDENKLEKPYVLSGDYYEEARQWGDVFITQTVSGSNLLNWYARIIKAIAFRGRHGEQVVLQFGASALELQKDLGIFGLKAYRYSMTKEFEGMKSVYVRHLVEEGDMNPDHLPHNTTVQWFRDSTELDIFT